ncbi:MAG TPA: hypothetical protein VNJ11_09025 [Bryobacteraceae bacterium]|nr:hypothetical protein [Bryobacteraceae bacterium]
MLISADHPLRKLFSNLVWKRLYDDAQVRDSQIADYVTNLLTEFVHVKNLYKIRNARGKRLEDVGEMLIESHPLLEASSFDREREVRKHIGDYTLFLTGLFPEYVASLPRRGLRLDAFVDYVKAGKESYRIVSYFDQFEYKREAPLFARLADSFELCVFGLNLVKQDLERFQQEAYLRARSELIA